MLRSAAEKEPGTFLWHTWEMGIWVFVFGLLMSPFAEGQAFSRKPLAPHLPSILNWKDRKRATEWGEVFFRYTPHYILMSGSDPDTIASIGSKLSHKGAMGVKMNIGHWNRLGFGYAVDFLSFYPSQDVAFLTEDRLLLHEFFVMNEYSFERFLLLTGASYRDRPYYTRIGANLYDLDHDGHFNVTLGGKYLMFQAGGFSFGSGAQYTYYAKGSKALVGNSETHGFQGSLEIARQSPVFEPDPHRWAMELYFRYEFSDAGQAERVQKDLGLVLKYDFSI